MTDRRSQEAARLESLLGADPSLELEDEVEESGERVRSAASLDLWFVTDGVSASGPMPFDQVLRGQADASFSPGAFVRHESWQAWRTLRSVADLTVSGREELVTELRAISEELYRRARRPDSVAPPPPHESRESDCYDTLANTVMKRMQSAAVNPISVLSTAHDFDEAILLTLSTAVTAAGADVGLLHRVLGDGRLVVTESVHGIAAEQLLGERFAPDDPTLGVAARGVTLIGEPKLGAIGMHVAGRLQRCLPGVVGVAMVPLFLFGEARVLFEFGRLFRPFRARDIARAEDVIEVLAERAVVRGWVQ